MNYWEHIQYISPGKLLKAKEWLEEFRCPYCKSYIRKLQREDQYPYCPVCGKEVCKEMKTNVNE